MPTTHLRRNSAPATAQIQCGNCQRKLPLRLSNANEPAALWECASCGAFYVGCCVKEALLEGAHLIRLDEQFFDITDAPVISLVERQRVIKLSSRQVSPEVLEKRRSERVSQSLVVPAVCLGDGFVPVDEPFPIMVSNLSREGVGMVHNERIETEYIAIEFSPTSQSPIQVVVRLVRQRELAPPYIELGGEFLVRLGSRPLN